ncbi:MAG: pyrimidine 5'-nucleotidase [Aeromonadaceae bacterium]
MAYQWILFDLDDTLFDFPAPQALAAALAHYSVTLTPEMLADYQQLNHALWEQYNAGLIDAQTLKRERFRELAPHSGVEPLVLNQTFFDAILAHSAPLNGVESTLRQLYGKVGMGIITNGFSDIQHARLQQSGLAECFEFVVISEELGINKPDPRIFHSALERMPGVEAHDVLMVGDNPKTDVAGAAGVGIETCWFNLHREDRQVVTNHVIEQFADLLSLPRVRALLS